MRTPRIVATLAALVMGASACGLAEAEQPSLLDDETLVIGTAYHLPGIAMQTDSGTLEGFDIDVANYIGKKLGYAENEIRFVRATTDNREELLTSGQADLVFGFYTIRQDSKVNVDFAGPYYVAHQDILVRDENMAIKDVRDLQGKKMCDVAGSGSWGRITLERKVQPVHLSRDGWGECIEMLKNGEVAAISTVDAILAGYVREGASGLKFVDAPFTEERIGIGIPKDDAKACGSINQIISEMYLDGTAKRLLEKWFGETGLETSPNVPQFEGCR